jgi:hypothetical protein
MPQMKSCGKPDNGPPGLKSVEPARQQLGGSDRRHRQEQPATGNNSRPCCDRQAQNLAALAAALPQSTWIHLRKACSEKEVRYG